jgi:ABC-2 type transport system ATP-binding protein
MPAIEADRLHRTFEMRTDPLRRRRSTISAVSGVSFQVERGELFGLLGPNGAGKSTTIKVLVTLLLPTSGTARVLGVDVVANPQEVRRNIGYVFGGDRGLYERLSALDNLRYFAELYAVPYRKQRLRIGRLLDLVGLAGRERERVEGYSRGMRQRLHIARGLLHDPAVLFLDEPSAGLDPVGARKLRAIIAALTREGKTVVLTTHYMYEADELCDRIAVIRDGRIIAEGSPGELKSRASGGRVLEVEAYGVSSDAFDRIGRLPGVCAVGVEERDQVQVLRVRLESAAGLSADVTPAVLGCLDSTTIGLVTTREPTLEDAYVELVGSR